MPDPASRTVTPMTITQQKPFAANSQRAVHKVNRQRAYLFRQKNAASAMAAMMANDSNETITTDSKGITSISKSPWVKMMKSLVRARNTVVRKKTSRRRRPPM